MAKKRKIQIPVTKIIKIAVVFIVFYAFFGLYKALWDNYKINQQIKNLELDVAVLEVKNTELKNLIVYLETDSYKEKQARERFGLAKRGETVLVISGQEAQEFAAKEKRGEEPKTNQELWGDYFFGKL